MNKLISYIVGLPYYDFKEVEKEIKVGTIITLVQDKDSKYSNNAVAAFWEGNKLGFIRKEDSLDVFKELESLHYEYLLAKVINIFPASIAVKINTSLLKLNNGDVKDNTKQTSNLKETNMFDKLINTNKIVAGNAAFMEAGRMANNQLAKVAASKAPMFARGYVDTPVGKLVIANLAAVIAAQYRPNDPKLAKLANAMMQSAYVEAIQSFKIEDMIKEFLDNTDIKAALDKVTVEEKST